MQAMPVSPLHLVLLFLSALAAGAINSVAGGGTLLTFPILLTVLGPIPNGSIIANGTSTVALVPGSISAFWGYRREMSNSGRGLLLIGAPSLLGGAFGAYLATHLSAGLFSRLVPWLILGATGLFLVQAPIRQWMERNKKVSSSVSSTITFGFGGLIFQFLVAVYGGFFGAGIGILMLAALGFSGQTNIHRMNGLKNFAAVCINGVGAATFVFYGRVHWALAMLMAVGAVIGGYGGAGLARRVGQENVRRLVIAIGLFFGGYTLYKQFIA